MHSSGTVRSLAFSALVSSVSPLRPFSEKALKYLQQNIGVLFADTDAKFRNEILSTTRSMIERFRGATSFLLRDIGLRSFSADTKPGYEKGKPNPNMLDGNSQTEQSNPLRASSYTYEEEAALLSKHQGFIQWYLEFLCGEMIPTASYQRHITALRATTQLLRSGILDHAANHEKSSANVTAWPYKINYFTPMRIRLLLDLLMDPFEDVRAESATILKFASREGFTDTRATKKGSLAILTQFFTRAKAIFKRTGRADYADGLARAYEIHYALLDSTEARLGLFEKLVDDIEMKVDVGERDLTRGMQKGPIHGQLAALRYEILILE